MADIDFAPGEALTATALHFADGSAVDLREGDVCIMTNACMTDSATLGSLHAPAPAPERKPVSAELWAKVAAKRPGLGNPEPFFGNVNESNWESFTAVSYTHLDVYKRQAMMFPFLRISISTYTRRKEPFQRTVRLRA